MTDYIYGFGHLDLPWTNGQHYFLPYMNEDFNNPQDIANWKNRGYTHSVYTGNMYDMRNNKPDWFDMGVFNGTFKWDNLCWSFYQMTTGVILPDHVDTFQHYKQLFRKNLDIYRAVVLLEDWSPGHVLTVANEQMPQWKAGDYVWFKGDVPHLAANIGLKDRYTLQLTGYKR